MRRSRGSLAIDISNRRLEKLRSIDPALDFGDGMSIVAFSTAIDELEGLLGIYNQHLSTLDGQLSVIQKKESELRDFRDRMLRLVGGKYGTNSTEYVNAGGTQKSARRRRPSKPPKSESGPQSMMS